MSDLLTPNRRILLVDDNAAIHEDFRRVLLRDDSKVRDLDAEAAALFGSTEPVETVEDEIPFELDSALQGQEALEKVKAALNAGTPYAMAFVDMRMPPGWDGLRTIEEIWKVDPALQVVICTAYSDRSWNEIQRKLTARDQWMVVKKPFDQIEVNSQLAHALTAKWDLRKAADLRENVLEQMVAGRTEQLSAALQTNSDFLDHLSHEMLTPMNGIIGFLEMLVDTPLNGEQSEFVQEASGCSEQLLRMLKQILAYNEAGAHEIQPLSNSVVLNEWLPTVIDGSIKKKAEAKGLSLMIDVDPDSDFPLKLPTNIVERVLGILVENAIKFTQSGFVNVNISRDINNESDLRFSVSDTGLGLTTEQLELINIPFATVDGSLARTNDGIGIGLPLARRLLALIGATLEFESLPGEGTCVSFVVAEVRRRVAV